MGPKTRPLTEPLVPQEDDAAFFADTSLDEGEPVEVQADALSRWLETEKGEPWPPEPSR